MMMTIQSGVKEISNINAKSVGELATVFSKGLLLGARGNSGVILSQIFRGFGEKIKDKEVLTIKDFSDAFISGKDRAYKAVLKPVEGTMLTVIREASENLAKYVSKNTKATLVESLEYMVEQAHISLKNTPELLPVLKEAGVIDSGGAGICKILEGFLAAARGEKVEAHEIKLQMIKNMYCLNQFKIKMMILVIVLNLF